MFENCLMRPSVAVSVPESLIAPEQIQWPSAQTSQRMRLDLVVPVCHEPTRPDSTTGWSDAGIALGLGCTEGAGLNSAMGEGAGVSIG